MTVVRSAGLDVSTRTGMVILSNQGVFSTQGTIYEGVFSAPRDERGSRRCSTIAEQMIEVLKDNSVDIVVMEGLAYANTNTLATLTEIHSVLKYFLIQMGLEVWIAAPATIKKFVLGKGTGKKDQVRLGVYKKWAYENDDDNIVDAYALAKMGLARITNEYIHDYQRQAIYKMSKAV